jgi:Ca2+-binding RTX toxin-like protein
MANPLPEGNAGIANEYAGDVGIASDADVLFFDDFESYGSAVDLWGRYDSMYQQQNLRIATEPGQVFAGQKSFEVTLPNTSSAQYNALTKSVSPTDTLFVRFYTQLEEGFNFSTSSAAHSGINISASYDGPGIYPNGSNQFLVALENSVFRDEPAPGYTHGYVYHMDQRQSFGDHFYSDGVVIPGGTQGNFGPDFIPRPNFTPETGDWYSVELMVQANTVGARDGRVAAWIDGQLIADWQNLRFRSTDALKIDKFELMLGAASNTNGADQQLFDNLVVADSYIGPMAGGTATPALAVTLDPASISENGGTATGTVTRSGDTSAALVVTLTSNDTSEATVPGSVTIGAGANSATFAVQGVNDSADDGTQNVTVRATAGGHNSGSATLAVTDDDDPAPIPTGSSFFAPGATPAATETTDPADYELGMKFTTLKDGEIVALRYYRGAADAGDTDTRELNLWSANGTELAEVTVTSAPGATGWQTVALPTPVQVTANTGYVVSYGTTQNYANTPNQFSGPMTNADGTISVPGAAGVFNEEQGTATTGPDSFPTATWNNSNYWADVIFKPSTVTPPPPTDQTINGTSGADTLVGGEGNDSIYGWAGADTIRGMGGNDLIKGGLGKDSLTGGLGADRFTFATTAEAGKNAVGRDVIADFLRSQGDKIDLSVIDAKTTVAADQVFTFIGSASFSRQAGQLRYKDGIVAGDVNGDGSGEFHIEITGTPSLLASDFIL